MSIFITMDAKPKEKRMYYLDNNIKELVRVFDQNERKEYLRLDLKY